MRRFILVYLICFILILPGRTYGAKAKKIRIVSDMPDLASIAKEIGGEKVITTSIGPGDVDPHFYIVKPSDFSRVRRADLLVETGLDLTMWLPVVIEASHRKDLERYYEHNVDCSEGIIILEAPTRKLDFSMGDIHIYGNPHYWLDPENGKVIARNIATKLKEYAPEEANYFDENLKAFIKTLNSKMADWNQTARPLKGLKIVGYHKNLIYFTHRFGLQIIGYVEPKPGIPPSPVDIKRLIAKMKNENVKIILTQSYYEHRTPDLLSRQTGAVVVDFPTSVGYKKEIKTYFDLFDYNIKVLLDVLSKAK